MNGELAAERVAAWHPGTYRFLLISPAGWWTRVRHTVTAENGSIRIRLTKNQSYYDEQLADQKTWDNPYEMYWPGRELTAAMTPPWEYIGWPFVHNSIMAIEIAPDFPAPVVGTDDKLATTRHIDSPAVDESIRLFNQGDYQDSLKALESATDSQAAVPKALIQLWLAGRLEVEKERILVPQAIDVLRKYASLHPEENGVAEALQDAEIFQKALAIHLTRGEFPKSHFIENDKACGLWWLIKEDSPLYHKSQLYIARAAHMLIPYIPTLGTELQILKKLEHRFPDNRYVRYYLDWKWQPYGDGTHRDDWYMVDYFAKSEGSPEWARELQAVYANLVVWAEWWIRFKQNPDGSIGGGWGDDVELVGQLAYTGYISKGASELSTDGARRLVEGVWNHSEVDPEIGYCLPMADAEHSAEWTGNTLGLIMQIDYGNPTWIERSMMTGKLIRDLWTDYNNNHYRHFRANYFGAAQVGTGDRANDSFINYRAVKPASAVLAYNRNPTIARLFTELADAWVADALSTERGKPRGVIPAEVSFPDSVLGGINSPNWYTASHAEGTANADWAQQPYKGYIHDLLMTVYRETGNVNYLEPLKLEYELAERHGTLPNMKLGTRFGSPPWHRPNAPNSNRPDTRDGLHVVLERWQPKYLKDKPEETDRSKTAPVPEAQAEPGSELWVAQNLKAVDRWLVARRMIEGRNGELENDLSKAEIVDYMSFAREMMKMHWPLATTEASATDRVHSPGLSWMFFSYTGGSFGGAGFRAALTYEDTAKAFAAAVLAHDPQGFRLLYHSMAPEPREIGIIPWELEPGGSYVLVYGPDENEDEVMDSVTERRDFVFAQTATPIRLSVEPRTTYVVEVEQTERGRSATLAPDPGLSARDIRYEQFTYGSGGILLARIHNVGSQPVRNLRVSFYDGDPEAGGTPIGDSLIPNIEAPNDLEPRTVTVGVNWVPTQESHEIYVLVDPEDEIGGEITNFNNVAHTTVSATSPARGTGTEP